jgi:phosphoribosylanthranilate isomerase
MWIKICGNTNLEDARFAADSGADAVGFVFAPSPRQVEAKLVSRITGQLPSQLEKYGVFVDAGFDEIVSTVAECNLTGVQIHRSSDESLVSRLRSHFARRISILCVLHYKDHDPVFDRQLSEFAQSDAVDGVLVDSSTARAVGGTGTTYNWQQARNSFLHAAPHLHLIAAGGLSPQNVREAIQTLRPWGVDVVSGVESAPGKKDPAKVQAFIRSAQEAAVEIVAT